MPKWRQVGATLPLSRSKSIQANRIRASRLSSAPVRANRSEPGGFPLRTCISTLYASVTNHSEREQRSEFWVVTRFDAGDVWTWTAIDADSKLILSYLCGERNAAWAKSFMEDL